MSTPLMTPNSSRIVLSIFLCWAAFFFEARLFPQEKRLITKRSDAKSESSQPEGREGGEDANVLRPEVSTLPYQIAVLDRVRLSLPKGELRVLQVNQEGMLDLAGESVFCVGMDKGVLVERVKAKFPQASLVSLEEFRPNRISVLGEVFHQLNSELADGPMRVMDAIAAANGFTPLANKRRVKLVRQNAGKVEVYELDLRRMMDGEAMNQNILLRPGDVITVPRNFL